MQNINYTPIDIEKMKGIKSSNINFYLLVAATVMAAFFSVLLFIYIQQKNEKLNQIENTEAIVQEEEIEELSPTPRPTRVPTTIQNIATGSSRISTPTSELKITTTPIPTLGTATDEAKTSSLSAY